MIVKIQQSLTTSETEPQMLVYNQDHSYELEGPLRDEVRLALDGRAKAYFEVGVIAGNGFEILGEVKSQRW